MAPPFIALTPPKRKSMAAPRKARERHPPRGHRARLPAGGTEPLRGNLKPRDRAGSVAGWSWSGPADSLSLWLLVSQLPVHRIGCLEDHPARHARPDFDFLNVTVANGIEP